MTTNTGTGDAGNDPRVEAALRSWYEFWTKGHHPRRSLEERQYLAWSSAISAADAARPVVSDEDVEMVMAINQSIWHECENEAPKCRTEYCGCKDDARRLLKALRAAGFEVVRR